MLTTLKAITREPEAANWYVAPQYKVVQIVRGHRNGCCEGWPILITTNQIQTEPGARLNYSAQCACGDWCTTGAATAEEALAEYERMTREEVKKNRI